MNTARRWVIMVLIDAGLVSLALFFAFLMRFDWPVPPEQIVLFRQMLPVLVIARILCNYFFGLYKWPFKYASLNEVHDVVKSAVCGSVGFALALWALTFQSFSRAVVLSEFLCTLVLMSGFRFAPRVLFAVIAKKQTSGKRTLIVGAGDSGERLARELSRARATQYMAVAFVDDDPTKQGMSFHGIPVSGTTDDIERIAREQAIEEIVLAMPRVPGENRRQIVAKCESTHLPIKTLPSIDEILLGRASYTDVRTVKPEDLLTREEIRMDTKSVSEYLKGKRILVTGAAGSIGSEICRQVRSFGPEEVILLDHNENELYFLERELGGGDVPIRVEIASVRDAARMKSLFDGCRPDVVFHAAAHKHVPLVERNPEEAIKNNIVATSILAGLCEPFGVEHFVLISTDKAIDPTSVMGCSKRIAEMIVNQFGKHGRTRFCSVRFGNVLGSYGSVVPLFERQIEQGGPVTVTDPEVKRYFMTIPEAVQLVLQTAAIGESGKVYMLKMGEQVKIDLLARDLITLHGLEPDRDIMVEYIGLRDGERLGEKLVGEGESLLETPFEHINVVRPGEHSCNVMEAVSTLEALATNGAAANEIVNMMREIVPTYVPPGEMKG